MEERAVAALTSYLVDPESLRVYDIDSEHWDDGYITLAIDYGARDGLGTLGRYRAWTISSVESGECPVRLLSMDTHSGETATPDRGNLWPPRNDSDD